MAFVSVIIPVYYVEKYLKQCVDSVLNQKLENIEIILVDDGSPDLCPQICDQYAENYSYIKVIHKQNGGLSSARNAGIREAEGKYIIFMDSDDWWNPDVNVRAMLDYVVENETTEMFLFTGYDYITDVGYLKRNEHDNLKSIRVDNVENYYSDLLSNGNLEVSAATKIIKKSFLMNEELYFQEGMLSEDNQWMIRLLRKLRTVKIIDEPLYICRKDRKDSITHTIKKKNILDLLEIVEQSIDYYKKHTNQSQIKELELCYASYLWFSALGLSATLSKKEKKEVKPYFLRTSIVCNYSNSKKTKLCRGVLKACGLDITTFILGVYVKMKGKYKINKTLINNGEEN